MQGLALGGEYGGAAIYVAEHAPKNKRGLYTSWIQTTATLGLFMALLMMLGIRSTSMGEPAFAQATWGWRIPFLLSAILLAVSIWIRLKLNESPVFQRMKEHGKASKQPLTEAFGQLVERQDRARWRCSAPPPAKRSSGTADSSTRCSSCSLTLKVPAVTANIMIAVSLALGTPFFILFGWLSDKIGRKPIILAGFALAVVTYFPLFQGLDALRQSEAGSMRSPPRR